jgi:hypothetical protein
MDFSPVGRTVRAYSEPGFGTTFAFYLPVASRTAPLISDSPTIEPVVPGDMTVLLVDDETDILEIARAYLLEMKFKVLEAKDGSSALAIVQ